MSNASVQELSERFCELQQDLAQRVEEMTSGATAAPKSKRVADQLETLNATLAACLDSVRGVLAEQSSTSTALNPIDETESSV